MQWRVAGSLREELGECPFPLAEFLKVDTVRRQVLAPWTDRVQLIDAEYAGVWELPAIGAVAAPTAVLVRPDEYVAWIGQKTQQGLLDALTSAGCGVRHRVPQIPVRSHGCWSPRFLLR